MNCRKILSILSLCFIVVLILSPGLAKAISPEQRLQIEKRPWYDPTDTVCDTTTAAGTTAPTPGDGNSSTDVTPASASDIISPSICCTDNISASDPGSGNTTTSTPVTGSNNEATLWNFLISKGLTPIQAAGVMGNFAAEGHFEPRLVEYGFKNEETGGISKPGKQSSLMNNVPSCQNSSCQPGYGIAQWTSAGRKQGLRDMATSRGTIAGDFITQLEFMWKEFNTGYKSSVLNPLKATSSLQQAVHVFLYNYENPGNKSAQEVIRTGFATKMLLKYSGQINAVPFDATISSDGPAINSSICNSGSVATTSGLEGSTESINKAVAIAQAELAAGVNEANKGYLKYTDGHVESWCADFLSWVLKQAGIPFTGGLSGGWRIPAVVAVKDYFQHKGMYKPARAGYIPKVGDIMIHVGSGSDHHTGIVVAVSGEKMTTIDGNYGNKVSQHSYSSYNNSYITGFGLLAQ